MKLLLAFVLCSVALAKNVPHLRDGEAHVPPSEMEPFIQRAKQEEFQNSCYMICWKGDGYCDDENNTEGCEWDGGDCCDNDGGWWDYYCTACECLDPKYNGGDNGPAIPPSGCTCGQKNPGLNTRITNGVESAPHEYPWQVGLLIKNNDWQFCGGSLVNDQYIVTAAHCTDGQTANGFKVRLGEHDKTIGNDGAIDVDVAEIIQHTQYNPSTISYDYSILKLASPVTFNNNIRPVCLPTDASKTYAGAQCVTSGWGRLGSTVSGPNALYHVDVEVVQSGCGNWSPSMIDESMMCVGGKPDRKGSCMGDSGGPLVTEENGAWTLIGITSWGPGFDCGANGYPTIFARVTHQLDWINGNIASGNSCPPPASG